MPATETLPSHISRDTLSTARSDNSGVPPQFNLTASPQPSEKSAPSPGAYLKVTTVAHSHLTFPKIEQSRRQLLEAFAAE